MPTDSILDELHRHREEYAASFNYDIDAIYKDLKAKEQANPTPPLLPPTPAPPNPSLQRPRYARR